MFIAVMRVSVIIPALDERPEIAACLQSVRGQAAEVIVVDGGSGDGTLDAARPLCDVAVDGPRGRATQMNLGAELATGDALLFLHADCRLEAGAVAEAARLLRSPRVAAGCFRMRVRGRHPLYRSIDGCATARVRLTGLVYGDQCLFLRRGTFGRVGGFPRLRFMEDVFISRGLRRLGRVVVGRRRVFVSPRRWERRGVVRQTLRNWALTALAGFGVHPDRLAASYPDVR